MNYEYNSLAIDAGKEGSKNYLDILLTNALVPEKPLLYEAIELYDGSFDSYYNAISETILNLSTQNIKVSGIVCDNLRVQSSAIEKVISDYGKTFIKVPCSCHTIQLSINDLFKEPKMSDSLSCIETFSHIFNSMSISSRLKTSFPKRCITRWSNVFDIYSYIISHFGSLKNFLSDNFNLNLLPFQKNVKIVESCIKAVVKWAPLLYIALIPFKILINNLEGDHVTSGYIYGFCRSAMIVLEQLSIKITCIKEVKQKLIQLIMKS